MKALSLRYLLCCLPGILLFVAGWNTAYAEETLSLREALDHAVRYNMDLVAAAIGIERSRVSLAATSTPYRIAPYVRGGIEQQGVDNSSWLFRTDAGISRSFRTGTSVSASLSARMSGTDESDPLYYSGLNITIAQPILRGRGSDYHNYGRNSASLALTNAIISFRHAVSQVVFDTERAYRELAYARQRLAISTMAMKLAEQLLENNILRIRLGIQPESDLIEAQSVVAAREVDLLAAENAVAAASETLNYLMNMDAGDRHFELQHQEETEPLGLEWSSLTNLAMNRNTEYMQMLLENRQNSLDLAYYKNRALPDLDTELSMSVHDSDYSPGGALRARNYQVGLGIVLRFPLKTADHYQLEGRRLQEKALAAKTEKTRRDLINSLRGAYRDFQSSLARINAGSRSRDLAEQKMKLMDSRFNLKLASNTDVLQAQKEYLEASTAYQKAVMDYHIARARIFHLCGTNLERYNIQVGPE